MHRSRIVILAGALLGLLSLPLPLVDLDEVGSLNGIEGDGWPAVVLLGIVAVLALLGDRGEGLPAPAAVVAAAGAGLAVVYAVVKVVDAADAIDITGGAFGIGLWLLLAAGVVAMAGALLSFSRRL